MWSAVLVAVFLAFCQTAFSNGVERETRILEDTIIDFTSCLMDKLATGVEECGTPALSPWTIDSAIIEFGDLDVSGLQGRIEINNLQLNGITDMWYNGLTGSITLVPLGYRIRGTPTFENIQGSTEYKLENIKYGTTEIFGEGDLKLNCQRLAIYADIQIALTGDLLRSMSTTTSIEGCSEFKVTGVYNDPEISQTISIIVEVDAAGVMRQLSPYIDDLLRLLADELVNGLTRLVFDRAESEGIGCLLEQCSF